MRSAILAARATLGGIALGAGVMGIFLFAVGIGVNILVASALPGAGSPHGTQTMAEQIYSAEDRTFWRGMTQFLLPLFAISSALIGYGYYEALNEKRLKSAGPGGRQR